MPVVCLALQKHKCADQMWRKLFKLDRTLGQAEVTGGFLYDSNTKHMESTIS